MRRGALHDLGVEMWRPINFTLHAMWFVAFIVIAQDYHFVDPALYDAVLEAKSRDAFSLAVQLGRLDFLNSVLAILALVIAGGAIFGIIEVRKGAQLKAEEAAREEAQRYLDKHAARLFGEAVKAQGAKPSGSATVPPQDEKDILAGAIEMEENGNG